MNAPRIERALVSGATGFVGRALVAHLEASATQLRFGEGDWLEQVKAADYRGATVFHLAARVHGEGGEPDAAFIHDNVEKTRALAQAAMAGGAKRFVFLSSIKIYGEESRDRPFRTEDDPSPCDAYSRSKWEAEKALSRIEGLQVAIVRAPLVFGPGVKGNLLSLLRLADSPWPLPFAAIRNRRSFVHVDDLARLLIDCGLLPQAAGGVFHASHSNGVSTAQIVAAMRANLGRPERLLDVSPALLEAGAAIVGQKDRVRRLTRSLEVDATGTERRLGWTAQIGFETAVEDMVRAYREAEA